MSGPLSPAQFQAKWQRTELSERAASQEHFIDLCRMLGQPTPAEHDATGAEYTFEKCVVPLSGASRGAAGERGFVDVWWRRKFAWEYKRKGKYRDLTEAYRQLCQYREALENPPLLIVSDIDRTEIHTNFTGTAKDVHVVTLDKLHEPKSLDLLRRIFSDPQSFKPDLTPARVTEEVARQFATLARSLRQFGHEAHTAAHFLMKCMFCLFAEDVELLPGNLFTRLVERHKSDPARLTDRLTELFDIMRTGGDFGVEPVHHFNGGLFDDSPALRLTAADIEVLLAAARSDWGSVEPAIFGTLFERSLDPNTRAQIGAHYTSREDILLVVEPVVMAPLRREWEAVKAEVEAQLARRRKAVTRPAKARADKAIESALQAFVHRLASVRILDPACGSGNFLYVAIQQLLRLEKEVITYAAQPGIESGLFPQVRPTQLHGIEINPYAAELAQVVIWIGYLQWMRDNGFIDGLRKPILEPLQTIECRDAILDLSDPQQPTPAKWPEADFIIGNPPFLGDKLMRGSIGDEYVDALRQVYEHAIPGGSDLCCYWFELARRAIESQRTVRAGLLATQNIRGGASRRALERIRETGDIFFGVSDRAWILEGANVHVAIIGFDAGKEKHRILDGARVAEINANLSSAADTTTAQRLDENQSVGFVGNCKGGPFDIGAAEARELLNKSGNPNGRPNLDVLRPVVNSGELLGRLQPRWIIDNADLSLAAVALYHGPHAIVEARVKPLRDRNRNDWLRENWWRPQRMRPEMRRAIEALGRFLVTPTTSKHRVFAWATAPTLPDHQLIVFARFDDYFLGVLHSSIHELWALRMGTQLEDRPRYTPTTCFETFPLPWPPGSEPRPSGSGRVPAPADPRDPEHHPDHAALHERISEAARVLNEQRERWLNPAEWIEPLARSVDAEDDFADVPQPARALIRQSAIAARAAKDARLKKRTLTKLYNERPTWLRLAHQQLDRAVLEAYAAVDPAGDWSPDWAEVWIETGAGQPLPDAHPLAARRREVDQLVLANLLRMNLARAGDA